MKRIIYSLLILLTVGCSIDRQNEISILKNTLITVNEEPKGESCKNGGQVFSIGIDLNGDSILQTDEIVDTYYVCNGLNGEDGFNTLIKLDEIEYNGMLPNGGVQISSGLDLNRDNVLDNTEVSDIAFVSNGENGFNSLVNVLQNIPNENSTTIQTGIDDNNNGILESNEIDQEFIIENGVNGEDGKCSFIVILDEPKGESCEFGGIKIITGKDNNRNLIFDYEEIDSAEYVCEYNPCIEITEVVIVLDFETFNGGDFVSDYGIVEVYGHNNKFNHNKAMIFDSNADPASGGDGDLNVNSGNVLIISEDGDSNDPDDNRFGGVFTFTFKKDVTFTEIDIIDIEDNHNNIELYDGFGNRVLKEDLIVVGNKQQGTMTFNVEHVRKVVVSIFESGAIDNIRFKCLQVINNCD